LKQIYKVKFQDYIPIPKVKLMLNLQPTLIGKLAKIRPLLAQDFENLYKAASDKEIWAQHPQPQRS
jgi:hypothetical protein